MATGIGQFIFRSLQERLAAFSALKSAAFIVYVMPLVVAGLTIYFVVLGIQIARGSVQTPLQELTLRIFKMSVICSFLISAGVYDSLVIGGFEGLRDGLSSVASGTEASPYKAIDSFGDALMEQSRAATTRASESATFVDLENHAIAGIYWVSKVVLLLLTLIPMLISYGSFYLTLAVGPLAIASLLFPVTSKYFDSWLGALLTSLLTNVAVALIIGAITQMFLQLTPKMAEKDVNPLSVAVDLLIAVVLLGYLGWKASDLAAQWVGGSSMSNPFGLPSWAADKAGKVSGAGWSGAKGAVSWGLSKVRPNSVARG